MDLRERNAAIAELEREIVTLQNSESFLAENRWVQKHMEHRARLERLIESLRERAGRIEEGLDF